MRKPVPAKPPVRARERIHSQVDWSTVRDRLTRALEATERTNELTPDQAARVLEERARAYAIAIDDATDHGASLELMLVELAKERYALETPYIQRVIALTEIAPIPRASELLVGVTNLQGEIVPVFDIRPMVGLPAGPPRPTSRIVVLGERTPDVGVLTDAVHEVVRISADAIGEPPDSVAETERALLRGVTREGLIVLRAEALLSDPRLTVGSRAAPRPR